jgi:hypothetical protein
MFLRVKNKIYVLIYIKNVEKIYYFKLFFKKIKNFKIKNSELVFLNLRTYPSQFFKNNLHIMAASWPHHDNEEANLEDFKKF